MTDHPIATTNSGPVRGFVEDGVNVFKGVRYGADTATTRFAAPKKPTPWTETRDALGYGASSPQAEGGDGGGLFKSWRPNPPLPMSEDCLFLNVWTPALRDGSKRPVMVWFHGGGFATGNGSSNAYDGVRLANRGDVVVVTVNHRLNTFGYMYLGQYGESFADSGNAGALDMVLALEWVRDNIAEFGGDPSNVLIFGESGGGGKVSILMAMESAKGLFQKGVVQSGPWMTAVPAEEAAKASEKVVEALGLTAQTIDQIKTIPVEDIQKAVRAATRAGARGVGSGPVLDGRALKVHPFNPVAAETGRDVAMMIGTCRTESSLLTGAGQPHLFGLTWETLESELEKVMPGYNVPEILAGYRKLHPDYTPANCYFTITTDRGFLRTSIAQADRKAEQGGAPVYFYILDWDTPVDGGRWMAPHALDIGFVFDNVHKSESMSGIGPEQQKIADQMSESWLAFAKTSNPNNAHVPHWPAYDVANRATMIFDVTPRVENDPRAKDRALFKRAPVNA
ncbi:MAG: carboxylesterase/lipase family protein [Caulobacteraceae bacterium]